MELELDLVWFSGRGWRGVGFDGLGRRSRATLVAAALAGAVLASLLPTVAAGAPPPAVRLMGWAAKPGPADATFWDAAVLPTFDAYSGYVYDPVALRFDATLFLQSGSSSFVDIDLGFSVDPSVAVSLARSGDVRLWIAVSQSDGVVASEGYRIDWSGGAWSTEQVLGPPPASSTNVELRAVSRSGLAVGRVDATQGLIAAQDGTASILPGVVSADLRGVDAAGALVSGQADFGSGTPVGAIWDASGALVYQDSVPGVIHDVEPPFAAGERNGIASYWRLVQGSWQPYAVREFGQPVAGALRTLDADGRGIAGGLREGGGALVVLLAPGLLYDLEDELSLPGSTLYAVNGVGTSESDERVIFAVEAEDFTGWAVSARFDPAPVPAADPWAGTAGAVGMILLARRRLPSGGRRPSAGRDGCRARFNLTRSIPISQDVTSPDPGVCGLSRREKPSALPGVVRSVEPSMRARVRSDRSRPGRAAPRSGGDR